MFFLLRILVNIFHLFLPPSLTLMRVGYTILRKTFIFCYVYKYKINNIPETTSEKFSILVLLISRSIRSSLKQYDNYKEKFTAR